MKRDDIFSELEKYRTPIEMKIYFESIFQITDENTELKALARLKKGKYKQFLEEFYPLYLYSQSTFCKPNSKMKIIIGNQRYDASIVQADGSEERFEFTSYIDGEWEFFDAKRLNQRGFGEIKVYGSNDLYQREQEYLTKIMENVHKKSSKDYSEVSIFFIVSTFDYFDVYGRDASAFIDKLMSEISNVLLKAKRVFLLIRNNESVKEINNNLYLLKE